jgi:hypothetical protein
MEGKRAGHQSGGDVLQQGALNVLFHARPHQGGCYDRITSVSGLIPRQPVTSPLGQLLSFSVLHARQA